MEPKPQQQKSADSVSMLVGIVQICTVLSFADEVPTGRMVLLWVVIVGALATWLTILKSWRSLGFLLLVSTMSGVLLLGGKESVGSENAGSPSRLPKLTVKVFHDRDRNGQPDGGGAPEGLSAFVTGKDNVDHRLPLKPDPEGRYGEKSAGLQRGRYGVVVKHDSDGTVYSTAEVQLDDDTELSLGFTGLAPP